MLFATTSALFLGLAFARVLDMRASSSNCTCGYKDNNGNLWREAVVSDFTSNAMSVANSNWDVQTWGTQRGSYYMQCSADNVYGGDGSLIMKASAGNGGNTTYVGELYSQRTDIQYGTFRMNAKAPAVAGAIFGFFSYESDTQETDIEFRTSDTDASNTVHYSNQPAGDANSNYTVTLSQAITGYQDHRFDWLPSGTSFYFNGEKQKEITVNVPNQPSYIILNVWSDGGNWSEGPPTQDAKANIQTVELYFNSSSYSDSDFNSACSASSDAVCKVSAGVRTRGWKVVGWSCFIGYLSWINLQ